MTADFSDQEQYYTKDCVGAFNILKFWNEQKQSFPNFAKFARCILSIPCSSAASERLFSCAGRVYEERRNRLGCDSLDAIVFLNSYLKK